jgi:hypothetical protein
MRDSNKGMIELFGPEKENDLFFSIIKLEWGGESLTLKFSISEQDYCYIRNIISSRPFENTAVGPYRYFFSGSYTKNDPTNLIAKILVRVEQNKMGKHYPFQVSTGYVATLLWFGQIKERPTFEKFMVPSL